jgi:hypothetical protein
MLTQTLNYLDAFARFRQKENVEAVERLLSAHKQLAKFERAQIGEGGPFAGHINTTNAGDQPFRLLVL